MSARGREGFRFDPPPLDVSTDLRWVLLRAFGPAETPAPAGPLAEPARLAAALGLAARIAARQSDERLAAEAGADAAAELRGVRAQAAALDLRLGAALSAVAEVAAARGVPFAPLKGRALVLAGLADPLGRPAADVDLLVPERRLDELQRALVGSGFRDPGSAAYEHQEPLLLHAAGGAVELHRTLPGVRLDGRRSATFDALAAARLLEAAPADATTPELDRLLPTREVLLAHALVHTLAQHAFAAAHAGFQLVADLIDLGAVAGKVDRAAAERWIEREVGAEERDAALALTEALAAGDLGILSESSTPAARLAAHFVACATDPAYVLALKARLLEAPVSDRPRSLARLLLMARTLAPPAGGGLAAWLRRPFELAARWRAARAAGRR